MNPNIEQLRADRARLTAQAEAILAGAESRGGRLTAAEQNDYAALRNQVDGVNRDVLAALRSDRQRPAFVVADQRDARTPGSLRDLPATLDVPLGETFAGRTVARDGSQRPAELRDLLTSTSGALVATDFARRIYDRLVSTSAVLASNVETFTTPGGGSFTVPQFTAYGTASATAEGTAIAESDPTLGTATLGSWKYATLLEVSREFLDDAPFSPVPYLADALAKSLDLAVGPVLATGNGTAQPHGVFSMATATTTTTGGTGVAGVPTADELITTYFSLAPGYRAQAAWIMADTTLAAVAKLKTTDGHYLLTPSLADGVPAQLLGRPVLTDAYAPATGTSVRSVLFGDWSRAAAVRFAGPMRVERSDDAAFTRDVVSWRAVLRLDSCQVDSSAAVAYRGGTA